MSEHQLLTAAEVAAKFRITVKSIWRRCEERRMVPPPVLERPYRFSALQVQQVIDGTYVTPPRRVPGAPRRFFGTARAVSGGSR